MNVLYTDVWTDPGQGGTPGKPITLSYNDLASAEAIPTTSNCASAWSSNCRIIINYPEQSAGYVFSSTDGSLVAINYGKEATSGTVATFAPSSPSVAAAVDGTRFAGAQESKSIAIMRFGFAR